MDGWMDGWMEEGASGEAFFGHRRLEVPYMLFGLFKAHTMRAGAASPRMPVWHFWRPTTDVVVARCSALRLDTERASVPWDNPLSLL